MAQREAILKTRLPENFEVVLPEKLNFDLGELYEEQPLKSEGNFSSIKIAKYKVKRSESVVEELEVIAKDLKQEDEVYALVELSLLKTLRSEYIIEFIGAARNSVTGYPVLVTEYLSRGTVKMALEPDRQHFMKPIHASELSFFWKQRFRVAKHTMLALDYLHSNKVVHRDIKSDNIFLKGRGRRMVCKIGDFGFARGVPDDERATTICGTDALMSPQMILNLPYTFSTDVFSYGCVLVELICGKEPGDDFLPRTPMNSFEIEIEEIRKSVVPGCPESLILLTEHCLAYEEEERILASDAKEWILELENDLEEKTAERVPNAKELDEAKVNQKTLNSRSSWTTKRAKKAMKRLMSKQKNKQAVEGVES